MQPTHRASGLWFHSAVGGMIRRHTYQRYAKITVLHKKRYLAPTALHFDSKESGA